MHPWKTLSMETGHGLINDASIDLNEPYTISVIYQYHLSGNHWIENASIPWWFYSSVTAYGYQPKGKCLLESCLISFTTRPLTTRQTYCKLNACESLQKNTRKESRMETDGDNTSAWNSKEQ
jgi:hypothetical protein